MNVPAPSGPPPDWNGAAAELRKALATRPDNAEAHNVLGLLLGRKGASSKEVLAEFREAVRLLEYSYTSTPGSLVNAAQHLPWWGRILVPTVGGMLAGAVLVLGGHQNVGSSRDSDISPMKLRCPRSPAANSARTRHRPG